MWRKSVGSGDMPVIELKGSWWGLWGVCGGVEYEIRSLESWEL